MNKLILLALIALPLESAFAAKFYKFQYSVKEGEDFSEVIKNFVRDDAIINRYSPTVEKIINKNPHIRRWDDLSAGDRITLYLEDDVFDYSKFKTYEKTILLELEQLKKDQEFWNQFIPKGFNSYAYFMTSIGSLTQEHPDVATIDFSQTSPITAGLNLSYYFPNSKFAINANAFISTMKASVENLENKKIEIPNEIGLSLFGEYRYDKWDISFFGGLERENMHSFDMNEITNMKVVIRDTNFNYATFGVSKYVKILGRDFITKLSISKSITSSSSDPAGTYDGNKMMFYMNYKLNQKIFINTLIRYNSVSGPSDLSSLRFGIGVGYVFF